MLKVYLRLVVVVVTVIVVFSIFFLSPSVLRLLRFCVEREPLCLCVRVCMVENVLSAKGVLRGREGSLVSEGKWTEPHQNAPCFHKKPQKRVATTNNNNQKESKR